MGKIRSALGRYVHLNYENYKKHGTLRPYPGEGENITNYKGEDTFDRFRILIYDRASTFDKIKDIKTLKAVEQQLNDEQQQFAQEIMRILNDPSVGPDFKKNFLSYIIKDYKPNISDKALDNWLDNLDLNTKNGYLNISLKNSSESGREKTVKLSPLPAVTSYHELSTLQSRLKKTREAVMLMPGDATKMMTEVKRINGYLLGLSNTKTHMSTSIGAETALWKEISNKVQGADPGQYCAYRKNKEILLSVALAEYLFNEIKIIYDSASLASHFYNITARGLEAGLAANVAKASHGIATQKSAKNILEAIIKNHTGSKTPTVTEEMRQLAKNTKDVFRFDASDSVFDVTGYGTRVDDKVDSIVTIKDKTFHASIKEINLNRGGKGGPINLNSDRLVGLDSVSLVSGMPLTTLLASAELGQKHMGNHFLNALTDTTQQANPKLRSAAIDALKLFALYEGLTGGQGPFRIRNAEGADVLIIQDKNTKHIHLFSISAILADMLNNKLNPYFSASDKKNTAFYQHNLNNIILRNAKVEITEKLSQEKAVKQRIKNLLLQAHQYKISVGLSISNYINKEIASR